MLRVAPLVPVVAAIAIGCGDPGVVETPHVAAHAVQDARTAEPAPPSPSAEPTSTAVTDSPRPEVEYDVLELQGYENAHVVLPNHGGKAPVVIVGHGAGGRPEPHCERYRQLVRGRAFIACTRGHPQNKHLPEPERGYFYDGHHELGKEVKAVVAALGAKYGDRVDLERVMYGGYSQGATMAVLYFQQGGAKDVGLAGMMLVEGGSAEWSIGLSAKLVKEGVKKVAIVCGQLKCREAATTSAAWMKKGGLEVRLGYAPNAGHTYGGDVAPIVAELWDWLVADDPRWTER